MQYELKFDVPLEITREQYRESHKSLYGFYPISVPFTEDAITTELNYLDHVRQALENEKNACEAF